MSISEFCLPHSITVFHKTGESGRTATYHKTKIANVRFDGRFAISQKIAGEKSLETFRAIIDPKTSVATGNSGRREYISSEIFSALPESERENYWTVCEGDYIFPCVLSAEDSEKSVTLLKNKMRVFTVNAFSVQYDSHGIHHLEVSGRGKLLE